VKKGGERNETQDKRKSLKKAKKAKGYKIGKGRQKGHQ
jgi:hypothetical protein